MVKVIAPRTPGTICGLFEYMKHDVILVLLEKARALPIHL